MPRGKHVIGGEVGRAGYERNLKPSPSVVGGASGGPTEAVKFDGEKLRYDLIPGECLELLAEVYTIGAKKYDDDNWRKGMSWNRLFRAMMSHAWRWFLGEKYDQEDGQHHLASVAWCAFSLMWYEKYNVGTDNRWINGKNKK